MIYISQTTLLYTLSLYSGACQLYRNKLGGKRSPVGREEIKSIPVTLCLSFILF